MTKCFGFHLTKTRKILILVLGLVAIIGLGVAPFTQLSVYGYAKEVPVQLGYNEPQSYWVLSSVISEQEKFKMVLHADDVEQIDQDTQAKAESEVGLLFEPLRPISKTDLEPLSYEWTRVWEVGRVPAYDINDAGWLTTARYTVSVHRDGAEVSKRQVNVNYKEQRVVTLETPHGDVTVNNLGILPQGVEVPSGDLAVILDPSQNKHVWNRLDLVNLVEWWNDGGYLHAPTRWPPWADISWSDFWNTAIEQHRLPSDVNLVPVSDVTYQGDMDYVTLHYADIVFAGDITVYIPSELADTIIVNLYQPKPQITSVITNPAPALGKDLPTVDEGKAFTLSVTIKNVGTEGSISTTIQSERYAANPITETFANFEEGESLTFRWKVYALNVVEDTPAELRVYAQGRGGDDDEILKGTILDVPGYTPPDPPLPPPPVPPGPEPTFPWELLLIVVAGVVIVWYVWRRKK